MKKTLLFLFLISLVGCNQNPKTNIAPWVAYDESEELEAAQKNKSSKMRYRLIPSKVSNKNDLWKSIEPQIQSFTQQDYLSLKPLILEQNIPTLQAHIKEGLLTYEKLTQWYLYRIVLFENDSIQALNSVISIHPDAVKIAREKDLNKSAENHPVYGIPILLKDNINVADLPTTAGAEMLKTNLADNAFIVERLQEKGAVILGKTNLSEWANYLCKGCPNGYSAVGGQTLNPYGKRVFDTGGSSAGSGSAIAANYAAAALGTETSGSILSPSSTHSLVGLKPTVGLLSRSGIVPISSTYDTPGPMTKNVVDAHILLNAMKGEDENDSVTLERSIALEYKPFSKLNSFEGVRFGVNKKFANDSLYALAIKRIENLGGVLVEFEPEKVNFKNFGKILDADMKIDLKNYLTQYAVGAGLPKSIDDVVRYNSQDSLLRIPYAQERLDGVFASNLSLDSLEVLKNQIKLEGIAFFETPIKQHNLDVILSINNWNAGHAAVAQYPCLTISMGYNKNGSPKGLTFIARPFEEEKLLKVASLYELKTQLRKAPSEYQ
ncbi:MAG: amidase [Flavobacteriaceae bacterium]|nr:amidase [Flavobacteriaceae bacterium]